MKAEGLIDRTLSWLESNSRVLAQVQDPRVPLRERVKFLAVLGSNVDEFFMACGAALKSATSAARETATPDDPRSLKALTVARIRALVDAQRRCFQDDIQPMLAAEGILLRGPKETSEELQRFLEQYFRRAILPTLTPLAVAPGQPFPYLSNRSVCLVASMRPSERSTLPCAMLSVIQSPSTVLPRFVPVPDATAQHAFMLLEDVIRLHLPTLYRNYDILSSHAIRVTRDTNPRARGRRAGRLGRAVRLEHDGDVPSEILTALLRQLDLSAEDVYGGEGLAGLSDLFQLYAAVSAPWLKDTRLQHAVSSFESAPDIWCAVRGDV